MTRSHLSNADAATGAAGVFGPGWSASLAPGGPASYTVLDRRGLSGAFLFQTTNGDTYTYQSSQPAASTLTGDFLAQGDASSLGATVKLDATTGQLRFTETDGTVTTFEKRASQWLPTSTVGTAQSSTTSYYYDSDGLPNWVIAPPPAGVTCTPTSLAAGCRAIHVTYLTTAQGAKRVATIDYHAWDPKLDDTDGDAGLDGLPDAGAGLAASTVAKYTYNADGTLQACWDPRVTDGTAALKTTYEYAIISTKTRLTTLTPPGLKPWQITYDTDGAATSITRPLDPAIGSGSATWTISYGLKLNATSDGLPDLTAAKTAVWGQPAADAPDAGAAVFGPDKIPSATPTPSDWSYAHLYYWNNLGRTTNEATYGHGAWQIHTTRYDSRGNPTWTLTPAGKSAAENDGGNAANTAAAAERYASRVIYNDAGTRVEAEYGPMRDVVTDVGWRLKLRPLTAYVYDDEADPGLVPGRPTTIPAGGFNLVAETRVAASDESTPDRWSVTWDDQHAPPGSVHVYDTKRTRYRYNIVRTGDTSGWDLRQPTQVLLQRTNGVFDTRQYSYDASGRVVQERTPVGAQTASVPDQQARWHNSIYYTSGANAARPECGDKPYWAGLKCWDGPAAQPTTGQAIPTTTYAGYALNDTQTRVVTTAGTATKTAITQLDAAGRPTCNSTTTSGVTDQAVPPTTTTYSTTTGLPTTVSNGTMTLTTTYDTWGRATSQTDGTGNTTTTTYDTAGRVATLNDGKGTYQYGYNGNDSSGQAERRGLPTSVNTGISGPATITGSYDASSSLGVSVFPGTSGITEWWNRDASGLVTSHILAPNGDNGEVSTRNDVSVTGQIRQLVEPGRGVNYTYDDRGRLIKAVDDMGQSNCYTRTYQLDADSKRLSQTLYDPDGETGYCNDYAPASTKASTYDAADRLASAGYQYDALGRTTALPAADTSNPAKGNLAATFHANDRVSTLTQGSSSQTYTLDPLGRLSTTKNLTDGVSLVETTNHYTDTSDSPAWTETKTRPNSATPWDVTWTRYVKGLDGNLAIIQNSTGTPKIATYNTHGDLISTISVGAYDWDAFTNYTEFGAPRDGATTARYGWLGQAQRDSQGTGGITLMGARLYNPLTGRFLSRDSVQGGNDNAYIYPADPVNFADTDGTFGICWKCALVTGIGFALNTAVGAIACLSTSAFYLLCRGAVTGLVAASTFLLGEMWARGKSFTSSMAGTAAVVGVAGFIQGVAAGGYRFDVKAALKAAYYFRSAGSALAGWLSRNGYAFVASAIMSILNSIIAGVMRESL